MKTLEDLEELLWELETAQSKPSRIEVSLEFWKVIHNSRHIMLKSTGEIYYKYLRVKVKPDQEPEFLLF